MNEPAVVYKLGNKSISKQLKIQNGQRIKNVQMSYISNSPFTESEFIQWKHALEKIGIKLKEKETIVAKEAQITKAKNYKYSNEEIDDMVIRNRKERLEKKDASINIALETSQIMGQIDNYKMLYKKMKTEKVDRKERAEKIAKYREMVKLLKEELKMLEELRNKRYAEGNVKDKMAEFNMKARIKQQTIDSMSGDAGKVEESQDHFNPFSRRHFQLQTIWNTKPGEVLPQLTKQA